MALDSNDLRLELGFTRDEWTTDDHERANRIIASAGKVVRNLAGPLRVDRAINDEDEDKLAAVDEATLAIVVSRFSNPERWLQARQGTDKSVSFGDASESVNGRKEAAQILRDAFGLRAGTTNL